jgi:hypothetical protein
MQLNEAKIEQRHPHILSLIRYHICTWCTTADVERTSVSAPKPVFFFSSETVITGPIYLDTLEFHLSSAERKGG